MSIRYQIPGRSQTADLPILGFEPGQLLLGSLLYVEPSRDGLTGAPSLGDTHTNYARGSLSALSGEPMSNCDAVLSQLGAGMDGRLERTSAGALHGYFNHGAEAAVGAEETLLSLPQSVIEHIVANPTHEYYCDAVFRSTQDPLKNSSAPNVPWMIGVTQSAAAPGGGVFFGLKHQSDSDLAASNNTLMYPSSTYPQTLFVGRSVWDPAPVLVHARAGVAGGLPSALTVAASGFVRWTGQQKSGSAIYGGQGFVFYSMYLEDCTLSGRPYTEAMAWRAAQVTADFNAGGRYHGEIWTNPSSVVW